jgi:ubiquinone/menaquinone biosynthesis C-methylase UbiE
MKKQELFHPRVFDDREWAEGYYKRNARNITMVGRRFAKLLLDNGFTGGRILDVGCGFAAVPIELARAFQDVEITGIDLGEPLLEIGMELIQKHGFTEKIKLQAGDAENLEFDDDSFDLVTNTFMLHVVEDPVKMLNETERVTKPDGQIMITDLNRNWLSLFIKKFRTAFTLDEALGIINKSQLRKGKPSTGPFWWDYMFI